MVNPLDKKGKKSKPYTKAQQVLIDYIRAVSAVSDAEIEQIMRLIQVRHYKKGKHLVTEGQLSNTCYFVMQGCVRQYFLHDGEEKTTAFFTEGMPVTSTLAFEDKPSRYYLVCAEDTILVEGTPEQERMFMAIMPRMETLSRMGVEMELAKNQEQLAEFIMRSPEDRYKYLMQNRPDLLDRVPQYQLASYLGVTPESLSRIRRRIMEQG